MRSATLLSCVRLDLRKLHKSALTIECNGEKAEATLHAEYLVNDGILGGSPAYEREVA